MTGLCNQPEACVSDLGDGSHVICTRYRNIYRSDLIRSCVNLKIFYRERDVSPRLLAHSGLSIGLQHQILVCNEKKLERYRL